MKRLLFAAVIAVSALVGAQGQAKANGFSIGIGLNCGFNGSGEKCAPPQNWSPCYPPPTMWGGMGCAMPGYGGYPMGYGGYPMMAGGYPPMMGGYPAPSYAHAGGYPYGGGYQPVQGYPNAGAPTTTATAKPLPSGK